MKLVDRTGLLWQGGLNVGRGTPAAADRPPVAGPDTATVAAGATVVIDVLGNDADPEGGALTLTGATADRGEITVNADGTLTYAAPQGFAGVATITYTLADPAGKVGRGTVAVEVIALAIAEGEEAGEFVVSVAPGTFAITVIEPAADAGTYWLATADLATGPVNLVPPRIAGTPGPGATLTARPGLWAFDEADTPLTVSRQWMRGTTPITGATGPDHVVEAADAGRTLGVVEAAVTLAGARQAASAGVAVPALPSWTPASLPGLAIWLDASDPDTVTRMDGEITELADRSGNGRHARKVTGIPGPTLVEEPDARPVLRFPSGGLLRTVGAPLPGLPGMPGLTVIALTRAHRAESFSECAALRNATAGNGQRISIQTGYSILWFGNGNRYWTHPPAGPAIEMARYPENGSHGATEWWRDGTRLAVTSTAQAGNKVSLPADAFLQLGYASGPSSEQGEWLVVVGPLGEAGRQMVEGYLAHKWGRAAALPDAHPHKAAPPTPG